jgi:hypothetical protein
MRSTFNLVAALALTFLSTAAFAADHREAPLIREDAAADIADIYAFVSPNDSSKLVVAMTVNPFSAPSEAVTYAFSPGVRYRFHIGAADGSRPELLVSVDFSDPAVGPQTMSASLTRGNNEVAGFSGAVTAPTEEPVANPAIIIDGGQGIRAFAGPRDDPFFFDVVGFFRFLSGTGGFSGSDGFAGFNVSAIVIEIPLALIGDGPLEVWGQTARSRVTLRRVGNRIQVERGPYRRIERMGNPAVNTALIPAGLKDAFNVSRPSDDAEDFAPAIVASLMSLGTNDENIGILASVAVPDTLKIDPSVPTQYPNGRAPSDDVIDTLLFFIFNQTSVPDGVDANDVAFGSEFPFLADPQQAP